MLKTLKLPLTDEFRESYRKLAEHLTGWPVKDTHIKKIKVHTFSNRIRKHIDSEITVGEKLDTNLSNIPDEPVLAIFESNEYLVITPDRNKENSTVYLFEPNEILDIEKET